MKWEIQRDDISDETMNVQCMLEPDRQGAAALKISRESSNITGLSQCIDMSPNLPVYQHRNDTPHVTSQHYNHVDTMVSRNLYTFVSKHHKKLCVTENSSRVNKPLTDTNSLRQVISVIRVNQVAIHCSYRCL